MFHIILVCNISAIYIYRRPSRTWEPSFYHCLKVQEALLHSRIMNSSFGSSSCSSSRVMSFLILLCKIVGKMNLARREGFNIRLGYLIINLSWIEQIYFELFIYWNKIKWFQVMHFLNNCYTMKNDFLNNEWFKKKKKLWSAIFILLKEYMTKKWIWEKNNFQISRTTQTLKMIV